MGVALLQNNFIYKTGHMMNLVLGGRLMTLMYIFEVPSNSRHLPERKAQVLSGLNTPKSVWGIYYLEPYPRKS